MLSGAFALILGFVPMTLAAEFEPPGPEEKLQAIGPLEGLDEILRRAFDPGEDFKPIPRPGPMDWLSQHAEKPQTFTAFTRSRPLRPDAVRRKIFLLPLGEFPADRSPPLARLREFTAAFFALETVVLPAEAIEKLNLTTRKNPTRLAWQDHRVPAGNRQVLTGDVLDLLKKRLPADAHCIVAVTMEDLYPEPSWNFVFGQALLRGRAGVYSFARYDPAFYGEERGKDYRKVILLRSAKVLAHEAGHIFGLRHCVHFTCLMNGSNHLAESDSRPLILCPVCLIYYPREFSPAAKILGG